VALQTWGSAFLPSRTFYDGKLLGFEGSPVDSFYLGLVSKALGLDFVLAAPDPVNPAGRSIAGGVIPIGAKDATGNDPSSWDRKLRFQVDFHTDSIPADGPLDQLIPVASLTPADPRYRVDRIDLVSKGHGYMTAPAVTIKSRDGNGIGATASAEVDGDQVTKVTVTSHGSGYSQMPDVLLVGPGTGAIAIASLEAPILFGKATVSTPPGAPATVRNVTLEPLNRPFLDQWLSTAGHGDAAEVKLTVRQDVTTGGTTQVKGFQETLTFPLRVAKDQGVQTLPFQPRFFLFEDPEYNRRLSSSTAQQSAMVTLPPLFIDDGGSGYTSAPSVTFTSVDGKGKDAAGIAVVQGGKVVGVTITNRGQGYIKPPTITFGGPGSGAKARLVLPPASTDGGLRDQPGAYRLTVAADRHEYNPTGSISYLYFFDLETTDVVQAQVQFAKIGIDGVRTDLLRLPNLLPVNTLPPPDDQDLLSIQKGAALVPGDTLVLSLTLKQPPQSDAGPTVELSLPIIAKPVTPVPEAGYALLRKNPDESVECVRFAFSPTAARIDLVDPNDLHLQIVRRRATFQWRDTVRVGPKQKYSYAVQKVTTGGSTHFPAPPDPN
jgi:hypothetical protein